MAGSLVKGNRVMEHPSTVPTVHVRRGYDLWLLWHEPTSSWAPLPVHQTRHLDEVIEHLTLHLLLSDDMSVTLHPAIEGVAK